ncbi:hypothetical protein WJX72_005705 [[Myrmecia] bisecta]|uniref:START domain-containing protein n=1 Tax=[Myrmecia] bisecta TaxID=41462 RepID=A0AAW1Q8Z4_9CHLO
MMAIGAGSTSFLANLDVNLVLAAILPILSIWAFGACVGLLLPRPKWVDDLTRSSAFVFSAPPFVRRLALLCHGAYIVREVWFYFTTRGTFKGFVAACWSWLQGEGFRMPKHLVAEVQRKAAVSTEHVTRRSSHRNKAVAKAKLPETTNWYITEEDLAFFKQRIEEDVVVPGAGKWESMCDKEFDNFTYTAWRRSVPGNATEYKSVTVADDATAEEFMDFYLDDPTRHKWDSMITTTEILENGPSADRCQVVRWLRTFPFSFISKREYIIGRRIWRQNGCLYGITKAIEHPRAVRDGQIVRMDTFYSMWRSRTIPCPKGSGRPACETVLLHMEQFKIPENLARFTVRHGMTGFVKKMGPAVIDFVTERRQRVAPFEADPNGYGVNTVPNPPAVAGMLRSASAASTMSLSESETDASSVCGSSSASDCDFPQTRRHRRRHHKDTPAGRLRRLGVMMVATGVALALGRSGSSSGGSSRHRSSPARVL